MCFSCSDVGLPNLYTQRRLAEADPILEMCDYSTDVTKSNVMLLETAIWEGDPFFSVAEAPYADENTLQLPCSLPLSPCHVSQLCTLNVCALNALSRNNSAGLPCQKASWLCRWKWACLWQGTRPWHLLKDGSRRVLLGCWAEKGGVWAILALSSSLPHAHVLPHVGFF